MKIAIIYNSQTGFTKRYAQWLAEAVGGVCMDYSQARRQNLDGWDAIVFGSWFCAGRVRGLDWFTGNLERWAGKRLAVFCVGASPADSPDIAPALERNFTPAQRRDIGVFYCPGGLNYEGMSLPSRLMMGLFVKALAAKKDKTPLEQEAAKMMALSYDLTDRRYIAPIVHYLRS